MESTNHKEMYQVAENQLTYKSNVKPSLRPKITSSRDAYEVLLENWDGSQIELLEQFKVMFLNRANKVLGIFNLSTGGVTGTVADPILFATDVQSTCPTSLTTSEPTGHPVH